MSHAYNYPTFRKEVMGQDMGFQGGPEPREQAPDFDLATVQGGRFRLSHSERPVFIEFGSIT